MMWDERLQLVATWPGWRRHAPAAGSVAFHLVTAALIAATLGVAAGAPATNAPDEEFLAIDLVSLPPEEIPPPSSGVTPPRAPAPRPTATEPAPSISGPRHTPLVPETPSTPGGPADSDSVYLGPPSVLIGPGTPPGLAGLMGRDECAARFGPKSKECAGQELAARTGDKDSLMPRSRLELAEHFGAYMPTCLYLVGCDEKREYISPAGTRAPPPQSPASAGAEQLGGIHDSVGRLDFNPDHFDRGFGD